MAPRARLSPGLNRDIDQDASRLRGARRPGDIGFAALRGGTVTGDHSVIFAGPMERIEFTHRATSGVALLAVFYLAFRVFRAKPSGHLARRAAVASVLFILSEAARYLRKAQ